MIKTQPKMIAKIKKQIGYIPYSGSYNIDNNWLTDFTDKIIFLFGEGVSSKGVERGKEYLRKRGYSEKEVEEHECLPRDKEVEFGIVLNENHTLDQLRIQYKNDSNECKFADGKFIDFFDWMVIFDKAKAYRLTP